GEARNVAIMREHPAAKLERMAVEQALAPLRRLAHVGQHRRARHEPAQPVKELIAERVGRAPREVRRAVDVIRDAPAIGMRVALSAERILRLKQRSMHLAGNDATKTKESAHASRPRGTACHGARPRLSGDRTIGPSGEPAGY